MIREPGTGRARLGRFAAITVPATVVAAGMGLAMVQGMVGASLSSAGGFTLATDLSSDGLKVRPGSTEVGSTGTGVQTIYAETVNATGDTLQVETPPVELPFGLDGVYLTISSDDPDIPLGDVALNAATLETDGATLHKVKLGQAQADSGFSADGQDPATGYRADGFSLQSGASELPGVDAQAFAVTLSSLDLDDLSLAVHRR